MLKGTCQKVKPIFNSLSPNVQKDDIKLSLNLLFNLRKWKKGKEIKKLEKAFKDFLGVEYTSSFNSGRSAFLAILKSLNFNKGDEILIQGFTCNAAVNPILWSGLKPVYVDIEEDSFNIDPEDLKKKITKRSKAVLVQHSFGLPADLERISKICKDNNLILIEDCAHSLGAKFPSEIKHSSLPPQAQKVGTFGKASFFSFGRDKIISSVSGGLAVTNDPVLGERIKSFQESLSYNSRFWILQQLLHPILTRKVVIPLYKYHELGRLLLIFLQKIRVLSKAVQKKEKVAKQPFSLPKKLPNALAILAINQFEKLDDFNSHRRKIANIYQKKLRDSKFTLPEENRHRIYMRYSLLTKENTDRILKEARKKKIFLDDGWRKSPIVPPDTDLDKMGYSFGSCPKAEKVAYSIVNLPTHVNISKEDAQRIIKFLKSYGS